ncbi:MAG: hypothetical protein K0Q55_322, partial [Verrucomicrobia bacterium]|nr:hypothetical protein [Verrucomicrobiota bacterium]
MSGWGKGRENAGVVGFAYLLNVLLDMTASVFQIERNSAGKVGGVLDGQI